MRESHGITLIALVITIIVLLILAGVTIATLTGENGVLTKATKAKDESTLASYLEEIKLEIMDEQVERKYQTKEEAFVKSIANRLELKSWIRETYMCDENFEEQQEIEKNTVLIINTVDNYQIIIDVDNTKISAKIRDSFIISGKIATIEYDANGGTSGTIEKQEIKVGSIYSFVDNPYVREDFTFVGWCEDKSGNGKVYQPKEKIIVSKEKMTLYAIWYDGTATSLLQGVEMINSEGYHQLKVNEVTYNLHMYYFEGNQIWNENKIFGDENDIGAENREAQKMVVVKVVGDLDISSNVTVEPYHTEYGGPKGFLIYCTGTLTNNGTIQNNYGAKATGENVYLWNNTNGEYEYVPALGVAGSPGYKADFVEGISDNSSKNGTNGGNANSDTNASSGVKRSTGGGRRRRSFMWYY